MTHRLHIRITRAAVLTTLLCVAANAQINQLDKDKLIEALANEGMQELLVHLIEVEPPADPAEAKEIHTKTYLSIYKNEKLPMPQRVEALSRYDETMAALIDEHRDHPRRPIWQTDRAFTLLFDVLSMRHGNAAEFYEFGVTTTDQKRAFEDTAITALELLVDASQRLFELQTQLPRRKDFSTIRDSGLFDRLMREYAERRTPYALAHAAHYAALVPASHQYYQTLGQNPAVAAAVQRKIPAEEKQRLHQTTISELQHFIGDQFDEHAVRATALCLSGRAYLGLSEYDQAHQHLIQAIAATDSPFNDMIARMAHAQVLFRKDQIDEALQTTASLRSHPLASQQTLFQLLVVDLNHRFLMDQALRVAKTKRHAAICRAYAPYVELLNDPVLGEHIKVIQQYVAERWGDNIPQDADLSALPTTVVLTLGELALSTGRNLAIDANQAAESGDDTQASTLREALNKLQRAKTINTSVLERLELAPEHRGKAMANLAYATYFAGQGDLAAILESGALLTELANQMPDQPTAESAIVDAVALLHEVYDQLEQDRNAEIASAYEHAVRVLLDKFGTTPAADNERLYFAFYVLQSSQRYNEAADVYRQVPVMHPTYWQAQRERLYCLHQAYKNADLVQKGPAAQKVYLEGRRLIEQIKQPKKNNRQDESGTDMRRCEGTVRLVLADMAIEAQQFDDAAKYLKNFEHAFGDTPDLIRDASKTRITAFLANDELDQAAALATTMMQKFPDDAAAVISNILDRMDQQIDDLRKRADNQGVAAQKKKLQNKAKAIAQTAQQLARLLLNWAKQQGFDDERMLAYKILMIKALRLSGSMHQMHQAVQEAGPLLEAFPTDANVIHESAESYYALGTAPALTQAVILYRKLCGTEPGLRPDQTGHYPPMWWNAWLRQFRISEALGGNTKNIPLLVNQLELTDPGLGGEPYASDFRRLRNKYSN